MCLYPKLIRNKKYTSNKKNGGNVSIPKDVRTLSVPIKCGKCIECMRSKSREWSIRLNEEIKTNTNGYFITLTLSNESIKDLGQLTEETGYKRDNEIITLANRRFLERWRKEHKKSVRHWLVSELGHNGTENVHLHGIIFTDKIWDLSRIWQYGFVFIGEYVNSKTINYVTKYVSKVDFDHKYYQPKVLCSKGIGSNYTNRKDSKLNKFNNKDTREYYTFHNGTKSALPIYYRNKLYNDEQREQLWINQIDKHTRYVLGEKVKINKSINNYTNLVNYYRAINKRLGYGSDEINEDRKKYENDLRDLNYNKRTQFDEAKEIQQNPEIQKTPKSKGVC